MCLTLTVLWLRAAGALQMWDLYQRQLIDTKVDIWVSCC
jgi:hypothetical protein